MVYYSQNGAIGVLWPKGRTVYFRFGAKMTEAGSKINVPRLKKGDLLIRIISTLCISRSSIP